MEAVFGNFLLNGRLPSCHVLNRSQGKKFSNLANRHSRSESKCSLQIDSFLSRHFQTSPSFKKDKFPAFLYDSIVNESISQSTDPKESRQLFSIEFLACVTGGIIVCAGKGLAAEPATSFPGSSLFLPRESTLGSAGHVSPLSKQLPTRVDSLFFKKRREKRMQIFSNSHEHRGMEVISSLFFKDRDAEKIYSLLSAAFQNHK